jgi:hypothetical protein
MQTTVHCSLLIYIQINKSISPSTPRRRNTNYLRVIAGLPLGQLQTWHHHGLADEQFRLEFCFGLPQFVYFLQQGHLLFLITHPKQLEIRHLQLLGLVLEIFAFLVLLPQPTLGLLLLLVDLVQLTVLGAQESRAQVAVA